MAIAFSCACGAGLSVPDSMAGKKGKCPTCGALLAVPATAPSRFALASSELGASRLPEEDRPAIRFRCPRCKRTLRVALALAGRPGKCAACGAGFTAPAAPARSLREAFSVDKVRCGCGLTTSRRAGSPACPACGQALPAGED